MKTKWPTEDQWLEIAKAFDTPLAKRNKKQRGLTGIMFSSGLWVADGICYTLGKLDFDSHIIDNFHCRDIDYYWWPRTTRGNRQRAFFCCMMAVLSEKDVRGMEVSDEA